MFDSIWAIIAYPLGFIMQYCYIFAHEILSLPVSYIFALVFFTLITKVLLFPLAIKQQRSTVSMAVYKPLIDEIQQKYKNDRAKQQEELTKLQQEFGYNPMAGCLPLLIQFPILFGLIEVIYKPLTYMLFIPEQIVSALIAAVPKAAETLAENPNDRFIENLVIEGVKESPTAYSNVVVEGFSADVVAENVAKIADLNMSIGSINLWEIPQFEWSLMLLIPLFSVTTMLLSSIIMMTTSGQKATMGNSMIVTQVMMTVMFGWFSFSFPAGMSIYWGAQNIIAIIQSLILKKFINVEKYREKLMAELEEKKKQKKEKKKVKVKDKDGQVVEKEVPASEMAKLRLQKARELDAQRYGEADAETFDSSGISEFIPAAPIEQPKEKKSKKKKQDDEQQDNEG